MEKGKVGEGKIHIIILYRGNLSERGKRRLDAKGRGICRERGKEKCLREEKGCFEEEYRGRNWGWERDKLKNRWGIDGSWTGNQTRAERELNEN